jgi:hypothetical protein
VRRVSCYSADHSMHAGCEQDRLRIERSHYHLLVVEPRQLLKNELVRDPKDSHGSNEVMLLPTL